MRHPEGLADGRARSPRPDPTWSLSFLVWLPLMLAFLIGWFRGGSARYLPLSLAIPFWISGIFITWWCMEAGTRVAHRLLPHRLPLVIVLLVGATLGLLLANPALAVRFAIFEPHFGGWRPIYAQPLSGFTAWFEGLRFATPIVAAWLMSNWLYFVPFGARRFGAGAATPRDFWLGRRGVVPAAADSASPGASGTAASGTAASHAAPLETPAPSSSPPSTVPNESTSLPPSTDPVPTGAAPATEAGMVAALGVPAGDVLALDADDHYTRVYLRDGSRYLRAPFGQLMQQLPAAAGMQISRSNWVAFQAIERVARAGRGLSVCLVNGQTLQVTRGYKVAFEAAWRDAARVGHGLGRSRAG